MTSEDVHPQLLRPGVPREGGRRSRPLHARSGSSATEAGHVPPVLRRVLRHEALGDDRLGRRDGAERLPGVAERRRRRGIAGRRGREAVRGPRVQHLPPAATRRAAARCSNGLFGKTVHARRAASTVDGRRGLHPRIDPEPDGEGRRRASSRSCRRSRGWSARNSCSQLIEYVKSLGRRAARRHAEPCRRRRRNERAAAAAERSAN